MTIWRNLTVALIAGLYQSSAIPTKQVASLLVNDRIFITIWVYYGPFLESRTALFPSSVQGHNS